MTNRGGGGVRMRMRMQESIPCVPVFFRSQEETIVVVVGEGCALVCGLRGSFCVVLGLDGLLCIRSR